MKSALYFPILRCKRGEITAVGHLSPVARARMRPTFDVPKPKAEAKDSLEHYLSDIVFNVARNWGTAYPLYFDFSQYGPDENTSDGLHPAELFFDLARQHGLKGVPVAGPISARGPGDRYLKVISRIWQRDERGLALRIPYYELSHPETLDGMLDEVFGSIGIDPKDVDVFIDLEAIELAPPTDRSTISLLAFVTDALRVLDQRRFRSIILCGSSLPEPLGKRHDWSPARIARKELAIWREILARRNTPILQFGDYGVAYPFESDTAVFAKPPSRVRLCTKLEHLIYRAKQEEYGALCKSALSVENLNELPDCWGRQALVNCVGRSSNVGSATDWVARDTNVHVEATVRLLELEIEERGLLSSLELAPPDVVPWLQQSFTT